MRILQHLIEKHTIIFVIYGADMELWLKHSSGLTYADDTSTSVKGENLEEVISIEKKEIKKYCEQLPI